MSVTLDVAEACDRYLMGGGDTRRPGHARRGAARGELRQVQGQLRTLVELARYERVDDVAAAGLAKLFGALLTERRRLLAILAVKHG